MWLQRLARAMTGRRRSDDGARNPWRADGGVAAVEFGLAVPLFLILAIGVTEFGRALHHHHIIAKSVRDAGRYLSRVSDPLSPVFVDNAKNLAMRGSTDATAPLLLSYWNDASTVDVTVTYFDNSGGTFRGGTTIPIITVAGNVPYGASLFPGWFGLGDITFSVSHEVRHIGE